MAVRATIVGKARRGGVDLVESFLTSYRDAEGRLSAWRTSLGGEISTVEPVSAGGWPHQVAVVSEDEKGCCSEEFAAHRTSMKSLREGEYGGAVSVVWGGRGLE